MGAIAGFEEEGFGEIVKQRAVVKLISHSINNLLLLITIFLY